MAGNGKNTKAQRYKRDRKRQETRKYGQAVLKHSHMGVHSCWYGIGSLFFLLLALFIAFWMRGKAAGFIGGLGMLAVIFSTVGIRAGVKGLREREKKYISCRLGIMMNVILLSGLIIIFVRGLT